MPKDLTAGLFFAAVGIFAMVMATGYKMGTPVQMGPGYFPMLVGGCMTALGVVLAVRQLVPRGYPKLPIERFHAKPLILILCAVIAFAITVQTLGVLASIALIVAFSAMATGMRSFVEPIAIYVILTVLALGIFVYGLRIPIKMMPW